MDRFARLSILAALGILGADYAPLARGANYSWNVSSGTWSTAADWNPATVPGPADTAWVVNGGSTTISSGVSATCGTLALGGALSGSVQLVSGGSLTVPSGGEYVGYTGAATFTQTGGTNNAVSGLVVGHTGSATGFYNLSGGSLFAGYITDGNFASGTFTQTGGTTSAGVIYVAQTPRPPARTASAAADTFIPPAPSTLATEAAGHSVKRAERTLPRLPFCWV